MDKVQELRESVQKVYDTGYDEGLSEGREQGYSFGFEEGKKAEQLEFWEEYYTTASWAYAFYGSMWSDRNYNPHKTITPTSGTSAAAMYQTSTITDTKVPLDLSGATNINYIFYNAKQLKTIYDITFPLSATTSSAFYGCTALENITVCGNTQVSLDFKACTLLKTASIVSIIEALLDNPTSSLSVTLSQVAVNNMVFPFTSERTGITYNSWSELENTKPNWTISLS